QLAGQTLTAEVIGVLNASRPAKGFATEDARIHIRNEVFDRRGRFGAEQQEARLRQARAWVEQIQTRVLDATAEAVAKHGGAVTAVMLRRLMTELDEVRDELRVEAENKRRWAADLD